MADSLPSKPSSSPSSWNFRNGELPYADALYGSALRLTRNRQDAEDLLQETYLKAFAHYDGFTEGTNLKTATTTLIESGMIEVNEGTSTYRSGHPLLRDVVLTLGAGDITRVGPELVRWLDAA